MKSIVTSFFVLLANLSVYAQHDTLVNERQEFKKIETEIAWINPIGELIDYYNPTPAFGIWVRNIWSSNSVLNYGFQVSFPKNHRFEFVQDNYTSSTKSFAGNLGLKLDKVIIGKLEDKHFLTWSTHLGYGFYFYDDVKLREEYNNWSKKKKEEDTKPIFIRPFSTIHLGQSIKYNFQNMGVFVQYSFTPYYLFNNVIDKRFGSQSISLGISYKQ